MLVDSVSEKLKSGVFMETEKMSGKPKGGLLKTASRQKYKFIFSGILSISGQCAGLIPFFAIYMIITKVGMSDLDSVDHYLVYKFILCAVAGFCAKHLLMGGSTCVSHIAAYNILCDLRIEIAKKLKTLPMGFFNKKNTGEIKKIMSEDIEQMEIFLAHNIPDFAAAAGHTIVMGVVSFVVDWRMALATIIAVPMAAVIQLMTMRGGRDFVKKWFSSTAEMNSAMVEYIQGMPVIKAFNHSVESFSKYSGSIKRCVELENEVSKKWYLTTAVFLVSITANILFIVPVGAWLYLNGEIDLGKFVFFLLMGPGFGGPMWVIVQFGRQLERHIECQKRIDALLYERSVKEISMSPVFSGGDVGVDNAEFGYDESKKVIKNISFEIPRGKFTALVGPSGAGKTTLARLIPRFWDLDSGTISIGNTDIRGISISDLMENFSLIFQNVYLFNDTILENLRIGNPNASEVEIVEAAKIAKCHEFIDDFPEGYNTIVGEKGARLSGGEKQRISIARAILKDSPILILDEATAFVDPENEAMIQDAINRLVIDKTLIVIAHRLSTIISADEIIVMDNGKIAAMGKHRELLTKSSLYKSMWEAHINSKNWVV